MKQDRLTLTAGFFPAVLMGLLLLLEGVQTRVELTPWALLAAAAGAYVLPTLILRLIPGSDGERCRLRFRPFKRQAVPFVLWISLAGALLAALANSGLSLLLGQSYYAESADWQPDSVWQGIALAVLLPAVMEELFFRGAVFSALERGGTWPALILTSAAFAMIHGDLSNLAGPLLAGMLYAYLTYTLDSVWPAIFAHLVNNSLYLFLSYAAKTYAALGVWPYMLLIALFLFCLFLALAMRSLEKLIEKGRIRRFQYRGLRQGLINGFISPGMWLLLILFLVRVLYQ